MDPRHPQHPFSRNNAAPYSHAPFQPSANQASFPPSSSHQQNTPLYTEHQRRTTDNQYYQQQPPYPRDGAPIPNAGHSRHTSSSSIGHGTSVNRSMPPPSSPQQQQQQPPPPPHTQHQHSLTYPPPPLPRGPPPALGPPMSFHTNRDLPSLSSIHRPSSVNSSMSISSMLGGPPPTTRESIQPASQYPAPPPMMASAPPPTSYTAPLHASPRIAIAGPDYGRYRRPQTPEHQRNHEAQGIREHRTNSASSPPRGASLSTPESHRYGTSQYSQRNLQNAQVPSHEERREQYPMRVPNPNSVAPPRPNSQPTSFSGPHRLPDASRLVNDASRQEPSYARPPGYSEDIALRERQRHEEELRREQERERERERERDRDRERDRERERTERREHSTFPGKSGQLGHEPAPYGRQYPPQQSGSYNPPADPRESSTWARPRLEHAAAEHPPPSHTQQPAPVGYEYPRTTAQSYSSHLAYAPLESRYPASSFAQSVPSQQRTASHPQYESPVQDRPRMAVTEQAQQQNFHGPAQTGSYRFQQSPPGRSSEDIQQVQQRGHLGIQQEINRKGRNSPFPQAVQGAQGQINGPAGEPGIKSEFGKMFSGIGSGVGSMGSVGASSSGMQTPFSNANQLRREDLDGLLSQDAGLENGGHKIPRTSSRGGRRRKLKEEDSKGDDDSSTGRHTPGTRGSKRPKNGSYQMGSSHRHYASSRQEGDHTSSPTQTNPSPFKNTGGIALVVPSPTPVENKITVPHHHHINRHHHHHHTHHIGPHHRSTPTPLTIPKPKQIVRSQLVLDSVAHLPRHHLGHGIYQVRLDVPARSSTEHSPTANRGFASTPQPLPRFEGRENCTYTVRIPRVHLTSVSRQEITCRRAVWGTDVYTDDSDIIAACIHSGWIRGEWPEEVDISLLGLVVDSPDIEKDSNAKNNFGKGGDTVGKIENGGKQIDGDILFTKPPARGPIMLVEGCDLHVTVLILPALERYASTVRWGIKSRDWSSTHDGLSFMIMGIKWVIGVDTVKEPRGKARRMRMKLALEQTELLEEERWSSLLTNGNGHARPREGVVRESFVRGDGPGPEQVAMQEISNLGMGSWWKGKEEDRSTAKSKTDSIEEVKIKQEEGRGSDEKDEEQRQISAAPVMAPVN